MMDVKKTTVGGATSITSMLVRNAIAKNQEQKEVLAKPIRDDDPKEVSKAADPAKQSRDVMNDEDLTKASNGSGNLVDVNV